MGSAPPPHEDDLFLLGDASSTSLAPGLLPSTPGAMGERKRVDVSWLRRTEYLSSEAGSKVQTGNVGMGSIKAVAKPLVELTRQTRCDAIKATFTSSTTPLSTLRHPMKPHLTAEASYSILPDVALWPNTLNLVRFGEDPGEGTARTGTKSADARLPRAIFRPVELPGDASRIGYYLPEDEDTASRYEMRRREGPEGAPEDEAFDFKYVRDYEVANQRPLKEEFIFCFDEGPELDEKKEEEGVGVDSRPAKRPRGAYYARLGMAQTLRKRRPQVPRVSPILLRTVRTVYEEEEELPYICSSIPLARPPTSNSRTDRDLIFRRFTEVSFVAKPQCLDACLSDEEK
ncbi:RNA polymerase II-associated factor 1, partial [Phenoliferia sp. Uapishka_3]